MAEAEEKKVKEVDIGSSDSEDDDDDEDYYVDEDGTKVDDMDEIHDKNAEAFLELDAVLRSLGMRRGWAPAYVEQLRSKKKPRKTAAPSTHDDEEVEKEKPKKKKKKTSSGDE